MLPLYQAGIRIYYLLILAASLFSDRARDWLNGRRTGRDLMKGWSKKPDSRCLWMHVSSLGEFEQGRPVIEAWKGRFPEDQVVISFYSPSGFNIRKNYPLADLVFYLPLDTRGNMTRLVRSLQPDLFILVKYDFWPNLLNSLHDNKVPAYLISAGFRRSQYFFRFFGRIFLDQIRRFRHIFVQDEDSAHLLEEHGIEHVTKAGDTRVDAVLADGRRMTDDRRPTTAGRRAPATNRRGVGCILAGSSWPAEEEMLSSFWKSKDFEALRDTWRFMIAPHDISEGHLSGIERLFGSAAVRFSAWQRDPDPDWRIMLIDSIGHLKDLYHEADIAVIGGGFGKGIHNILEPAAAGLPVLIGPNYRKFHEAVDLVGNGAAFTFKRQAEFNGILNRLCTHPEIRQNAGHKAYTYLLQQKGATLLIIKHLLENR